VDAYAHPVCDRHAPLELESEIARSCYVDDGDVVTLPHTKAHPDELAVVGVDHASGIVTIGVQK
jgi:hypothetical protein